MTGLNALAVGISEFFQTPHLWLVLAFGVFVGITLGAIPGLTGTLGVTICLPFTYVMPSYEGLTLLIGIYVGGIAGGLISSVTLNIPGAPAAMVTCFDGSPMARQGKVARALRLGVFASLVGGVFSALALIIIAPWLARISVQFGAWEYFALGLMGLAVVIGIIKGDKIKGVMAAIVGVLIASVGYDPIGGAPRFIFGRWELGSGIYTLSALMGLFAVVEIMNQVKTLHIPKIPMKVDKIKVLPDKDFVSGENAGEKRKVYGIASVIGTFVGILPGIGSGTASMMAYNICQNTSKNKEKYGTGYDCGVIASEAANNAVCGGALIPMICLGIPGDMVTAVLMGGLTMNGLTPGPTLFMNQADIIGIIFAAYLFANFVMYFMENGMMKYFVKILSAPMRILAPIILVMCVVGTITVHNRVFDSWMLLAVGVLGYLLNMAGFPLIPTVLGYILGGIIEKNFRTGVGLSEGNVFGFLDSPVATAFLVVAVLMIVVPMILERMPKKAK